MRPDKEIRLVVTHLIRSVRLDHECWLWQGTVLNNGYGTVKWCEKRTTAHRAVWELLVGPVPDHMELDHLCRNPQCVNPKHLEPVTPRENKMRGVGITAQYAQRTHCKNGHEFTPDNTTYLKRPDGIQNRRCKECHRQRAKAAYQKKKRAVTSLRN